MSRIVVNCRKVNFESTLGVAHVLLRLCNALAEQHHLIFVVNDVNTVDSSPAGETIRDIATEVIVLSAARSLGDEFARSSVELLPHHFQPPEICDLSVMMCLDLHVFDIPWKYGEQAAHHQQVFRRNLLEASAVMTLFPRTYYEVERTAGITVQNLFLTESPLLLPAPVHQEAPVANAQETHAARELLYPAQLQLHKNHEALVHGVAELRRRGSNVRITCPGSDFAPDITAGIMSLIDRVGVSDSFKFSGRVSDEDLIDLYQECDGVIVPSVAEGGAYVPLEAIAFAKPVAVNDIDSARMHLDSMLGNVIWFNASDCIGTADAMQQLIDADPVVWFYKNDACRERIATTTWESVAEKWGMIIGMLQDARPRPIVGIDSRASEIVYA